MNWRFFLVAVHGDRCLTTDEPKWAQIYPVGYLWLSVVICVDLCLLAMAVCSSMRHHVVVVTMRDHVQVCRCVAN